MGEGHRAATKSSGECPWVLRTIGLPYGLAILGESSAYRLSHFPTEQTILGTRRKEANMADPNGRFVWYELLTTDLAAARAFYSRVVGWNAIDSQMTGMDYWMFAAGEKPVAGLMTLPEDARKMGTPPSWMGYVAVPDVDATAAKVTA